VSRESLPTVRDVARLAGVSPGTVSRLMGGRRGASDETRRRVLAAVQELGYTPDPAATRLATGRSLVVAVIVPFFTRPSVSERLNGVVTSLADTPYDLVIHNVETAEQRARCLRLVPRRRDADGVLIISLAPGDAEASALLEARVPVVLIDADHCALAPLSRVVVDDEAGGRAATEHLLALGHTRIGFLGDVACNPLGFTSSRDRHRGYLGALAAAGIEPRAELCAEGDHSRAEARALAHRLLRRPERPTALVAASDTQAAGALEAARELGLRVPEDVSVVGYDDIEIADALGLTTVRQPLQRSGRRGTELLLARMRDPGMAPVREVLPTELVVRRTTAPPPG
jgi:DNA-binding LacI/PurR family transcriptional regulator